MKFTGEKMKRHFPAAFQNMKRLSGIPFSKKVTYVLKAVSGEMLRTRTVGTFGLRLVEISLTDRCQCSCKHCFAAKKDDMALMKEELSTREVMETLDEVARIGGVEIVYSGGEPLLRDDMIPLVEYAHKKGLVTRIITNGVLLDEEVIKNLKHAGLNWCSLSVDSPRPEIHDEFRGYPGCFDKVANGIRLLVKHNVPCSIIAVARKELIHSGELEEIVKWGKSSGVDVVRINFPVPIGRYSNRQDEVLNREEREQVRKLLKYGNVSMEAPKEGTKCTAAVTKINILPGGDVTPCVFVPISYGNIKQQKFQDIWHNMGRFTGRYKIKGQCPVCDPEMREQLYLAAEKDGTPPTR